MVILKRLVGLLLLLAGLVPLALGGYAAARLGTSGAATFTVPGVGTEPILLTPDVLNRTDLPVRIDIAPKTGGSAVAYVAAPSDTMAAIGSAGYTKVTGIQVREATVTTAKTSGGDLDNLVGLDFWRESPTAEKATALTITQDTAPESVLIAPDGAGLESLTLTWAHDTWFYQALVLAAAGALLVVVGGLLLFRSGPRTKETAR